MRLLQLLAYLILMSSLSAQSFFAPHTAEFSAVVNGPDVRPTITGRVINTPDDWKGTDAISFSTVTFGHAGQIKRSVSVTADGTFVLELPENLPAVEVWFSFGNLYFGSLWVDDALEINIDYAALQVAGETNWIGPGITFSGPNGELTTARNEMIRYGNSKGWDFDSPSVAIVMDRGANAANRQARMDTVFANRIATEAEYLASTPEKFQRYYASMRESHYLGWSCVFYWKDEAAFPDKFRQRCLAHSPVFANNDSQSFYQYFRGTMTEPARAATFGDTTRSVVGRRAEYARLVAERFDAEFEPARADLFKLYVSDKEPANHVAMLETLLPTVQTEWVRQVMEANLTEVLREEAKMEAVLSQKIEVSEIADLGTLTTQFPFSADLYVTDEALSGEQLLAKIRGAFPGQHLYLDFWATWCGPCRQELPFSSKLHAVAEELPVTFVYLCTDSGSDRERWEAGIAEYQVPGVHLYVNAKTHQEIMDVFNGSGFPTYVLLNPNGEANLGVARPSALDREKLEALLND